MSACDPLIQAERRFKSTLSESKQMGFVPLPRAGGALSHTVGSIRDLRRHCQTSPGPAKLSLSHLRIDGEDAGFFGLQRTQPKSLVKPDHQDAKSRHGEELHEQGYEGSALKETARQHRQKKDPCRQDVPISNAPG